MIDSESARHIRGMQRLATFGVTMMLSLGLLGCEEEGKREVWEVGPTKTTCVYTDEDTLCLETKGPDDEYLSALYGGIEGLEWEWGTSYVIEVEISEYAEPPLHGSSLRYELVEIIEQTPVEAGFEFVLTVSVLNREDQEILDGTPYTCEPELCEALAAASFTDDRVRFAFGPLSDPLPLEVVAIETE